MLRAILLFAAALGAAALVSAAAVNEPAWWVVGVSKMARLAIQPSTGEIRPLPEVGFDGVPSPDGSRIAFIRADDRSKRDFDLFVADVDLKNPAVRINTRMLTSFPVHNRPTAPQWTPNSRGLVFLAGAIENQQAWYVDAVDSESQPVQLSGGQHPVSNLCISATGGIAYLVLTKSQGKQRFHDLIIINRHNRSSDFSDATRATLSSGQHLTSMAFSPDGTKLAYAGINTLRVHDFGMQKCSEIHYEAITPKLVNHLAWELAWRPDGKVIAAMMSFAGGISYEAGKPPRMFAEDKVFLIPADWSAPAPTYDPTAKFPSPTIDEAADDRASPMPADESKPGWVRMPRERIQRIEWIPAAEVPLPAQSQPAGQR